MRRTRPTIRRWPLAAIALATLLAGACASESGQALRSTPTARAPTPAATAGSTPVAPGDGAVRWGYDPRHATGERDPPPLFSPLPSGYRIETVASGLRQPTSLAFAPDGRLFIAEQAGTVRVVENGALLPDPFYVADAFLPDVGKIVELGLVGITADPDFARNRSLYLYYTTDRPERRTVLARIHDEGGRGGDLEEVLSMEAAPECCHIAGSLRFAPDGTLFVTVGDHQMEASAQDRGSPFGSVLRIDRDGYAPPDNPFVDDPNADPRVYAYGLRNPFDLAIDPTTGRVFATENGFLGQDAVIEVQPGANYGWPGSGLAVPVDDVVAPLLFYHQAIGPSGIEFYSADALPLLTGTLLFCQFHQGGALHGVVFDTDGSVAFDTILAPGCTSDVTTGPDGFIYFVDYVGGVVYRIATDQRGGS